MEDNNFISQTEQEAWVGILFACMASDLKLQDIETDTLVQTVTKKEAFKSMLILQVYRDVMLGHSKLGSKGLIDVCKEKVSADYKETLFAIACEIIFADGNEEFGENEILNHLASALQLDSTLKGKITDVMRIKNKGNKLVTGLH
jgi:hypothetical protein